MTKTTNNMKATKIILSLSCIIIPIMYFGICGEQAEMGIDPTYCGCDCSVLQIASLF
jgi:hypothetical protein